jgi:hypothetical protein
MSPLLAYFLGLFTVFVIFLPFWYLARVNNRIAPTYKNIFCSSGADTALNRTVG